MSNWKRITLLGLGLLLCLPFAAVALQKGETFPGLTGETLSGAAFDLEDFRGQPILLKIGTTWCGTCQQQTKTIDKLRDYMDANGVQYVDVFIQESKNKVADYFRKKGFQLPDAVILDDGPIAKKLNIYLIPRIILIDKNYKVQRDGDTISKSSLKKKLQAIIASK